MESSHGSPSLESGIQSEKSSRTPYDKGFVPGWRWLSILSSTFLFALDNTLTANIQADIVREFDGVDRLTWISVGLVMSAAATSLLWDKVFFYFNPKWTYIISVLLFEVGSAPCGVAPNMDTLIVGPCVVTLLTATTTLHERPRYVASTGLTWGLGMVLGPIMGACAPVYLFLIPNIEPRKGAEFMNRAREIDIVGEMLNIGEFVSGTMAISACIMALFICSGVLFDLLAIQQIHVIFTTVERRLVPVEFFKSRTMLILFAATSGARTATFICIYMILLFFQFTRGEDAFETRVRLLPFIVLYIFATIVNGAAMSAFGYYMPWYTVGGALVLIGGALFYSTVDTTASVASIYGYSAITGLSGGMYLQTGFSIAQASVERTRVVGRQLHWQLQTRCSWTRRRMMLCKTVISGASELIEGLTEDLRRRVEEGIVTGALTLVLSLLMKRERLFKK
ncbi:major facilitator superfamily domain-containing protein [Aspergillus germanicus]